MAVAFLRYNIVRHIDHRIININKAGIIPGYYERICGNIIQTKVFRIIDDLYANAHPLEGIIIRIAEKSETFIVFQIDSGIFFECLQFLRAGNDPSQIL